MIVALAVIVSLAVGALLTLTPFSRKDRWRATVTPLASIIGSGFLVCAPLLAREFGWLAAPAMAVLLIVAYLVGSVVRHNIRHVEPYLAQAETHDPVAWLARIAQVALSLAYAVSVAYYLKLLAAFILRDVAGDTRLLSNGLVTVLIAALAILPFTGGLRRVEHLAHATVSIKLGIIAGLLTALGAYWLTHLGQPFPIPAARLNGQNVFILLGLLITVQGFETSRYLGESYDAQTRVRTMREAQWISSAIYLLFLLLLTPFLGQAARTEGVAGILDIMKFIAPLLAGLVLVGAVTSQLSAAVADSIGASGILVEVTRKRLKVPVAYAIAAALSVAVVWLTNPFQVIALSSRAFALYYGLQCALAIFVSKKTNSTTLYRRIGFAAIGAICLLAAVAGAPAE